MSFPTTVTRKNVRDPTHSIPWKSKVEGLSERPPVSPLCLSGSLRGSLRPFRSCLFYSASKGVKTRHRVMVERSTRVGVSTSVDFKDSPNPRTAGRKVKKREVTEGDRIINGRSSPFLRSCLTCGLGWSVTRLTKKCYWVSWNGCQEAPSFLICE